METQKFMVTSKRNDYLYAYHTEYEVGDDNDREIAMKAIERCKPPLLDLRVNYPRAKDSWASGFAEERPFKRLVLTPSPPV